MKNIKSNKGISMTDLIIALLVLTLLSGIIGNLLYQISYHTAALRMNAIAVDYAIRVAENIDKMTYEEVTSELTATSKEDYDLLEPFEIQINVTNYNEDNTSKSDIIKIVNIKVNYTLLKQEKTYEIRKCKVKEM